MRSEPLEPTDAWSRDLLARAAQIGASQQNPGRVLSVKLGHNPNSSSVGSVVSLLAWTATVAAVAVNVVATLAHREASAAAEGRGPAQPPDPPAEP